MSRRASPDALRSGSPRPREAGRRSLTGLLTLVLALAPAGPEAGLAAAQDAAAPGPERFSIEEVLGAPFPSELVADSERPRFAWVRNDRGVRNVWVAEAPAFRARRVTGHDADDGRALSDLRFVPGGDRIAYVRGGAPNRQGEHPNPTHRPSGAERVLRLVDVESGADRRVGEGRSPEPSPDGEVIAFVRNGDIWTVEPDGDAGPERLAEVRGSPSTLRWSPDGRRIAFVSSRGDHSFVGIVERDGGTVRYLDPSVDDDRSPVWSPDGGRVAFVRVPGERDRLPFIPRREGLPWSIRVADLDTGEGREVWRAPEGYGSVFRGTDGRDQLVWSAGDRIVFPWESGGWLRLHSVPVSGDEEPVLLTPGPLEVQFVAAGPERRTILYDSNRDDIDRKHLWSVPADGRSEPRALTSGAGIEWGAAPLSDGESVAFLASTGTEPARVEVLLSSGERRRLDGGAPPEPFPVGQLVEPRQVVFPAADGLEIHGQLFLPPDAEEGDGRPGVLFFHGGSRRQMLLGFHHRGYYHNAYALNQYLASRGYVVLSVNYRSGIGYGLEFREAEKYGAAGASEYHDVVGAGLYLRNRPEVDADRVGLWGGSYGGYLTALGLARSSDLFAAGVDLHGVHDWNVVIRNFVPSYEPEARPEFSRRAFDASPLADVERWRSPVLLIHGDDDRNVPFSESVDLAESLRKQGVEFEQLVFPDEVHGFLLHRNWLRAFEATADFFERKLGATTP